LVEERHIDPASHHKDLNLATLAPRKPLDLAKKANLYRESNNTSKNKVKCNSIEETICRYMIKISTWSFTNQKAATVQ
jgi:hypothetical protein